MLQQSGLTARSRLVLQVLPSSVVRSGDEGRWRLCTCGSLTLWPSTSHIRTRGTTRDHEDDELEWITCNLVLINSSAVRPPLRRGSRSG